MFMHDHSKEAERDDRWCPLMKEICIAGWTESMGTLPNKKRPVCKAWQPVTVVNPMATPKQVDVFDCSVFGWAPDLAVQTANEAYHGAVATEEVRNKVAEANGMNQIVLGFFHGLAKRWRMPFMIPEAKGDQKSLGHKKGDA